MDLYHYSAFWSEKMFLLVRPYSGFFHDLIFVEVSDKDGSLLGLSVSGLVLVNFNI